MERVALAVVAALAVVGLVVGAAFGTTREAGYETTHVVMLDQALQISSGSAGPRSAAFVTVLGRGETRQRAGAISGEPPGAFSGIFARRIDNEPVMELTMVTDDADSGSQLLDSMARATLLELIEQERAVEQLVVASTADELGELRDRVDAAVESADLRPGTDLADRLERDRFNLTSARAQLENLPEDESYWRTRLPGDIEALEQRVAATEAVFDEWRAASERLDELDDAAGDATDRLAELEVAQSIAESGSAVVGDAAVARSNRVTIGRSAAIGASVGIVVGLIWAALRDGRRRKVIDLAATERSVHLVERGGSEPLEGATASENRPTTNDPLETLR